MTKGQIEQRAEDFIVTRQNQIKYYSGEAVKILLKNFAEEIVAEATKELQEKIKDLEWQLQEVAKDNDYYQKENKELQEKLTEAKELLQSVVHQYRREGVDGSIVEAIEAFLKE